MGIKGIHLGLILAASILSIVFGFWGLQHQYQLLGTASLAASIALLFYGINFWKKAKTL